MGYNIIMKKITTIIFFAVLIAGCGKPSEVMSAEFQSLSECLSSIQSVSGHSLKIITDEPDNVSGFLSNGEHFGCIQKSSGTKGIFFEGYYSIE